MDNASDTESTTEGNRPAPLSPAEAAAGRARQVFAALAAVVAVVILLLVLYPFVAGRGPLGGSPPAPERDFGCFASPEFPLDRGSSLVLVLAMDCEHCQETARQVGAFDAAAHGLRVYFLLFGEPDEVALFFAVVGATVPYHLATAQEYDNFSGDEPTTIYLLKDGKVRSEWAGRHFSLSALRDELARKR